MSTSQTLSTSTMDSESPMPISYIYDPIPKQGTFDLSPFTFLDLTKEDHSSQSYPNSTPARMEGISWQSLLPGCRQCKHWGTTDRLTKELLHAVNRNAKEEREHQDNGTLPPDLDNTHIKTKEAKEKELLATAIKSSVYMCPDASAVRSGMIAQTMLFTFLHDDVVEDNPERGFWWVKSKLKYYV